MFAGALREEVFSRPSVIEKARGFVPVAVEVPKFRGPAPEAKLMDAIRELKPPRTSGTPVPQGLCTVTAEGGVIEWRQIFDDEEAVLAFLDRGLGEAEPNVEVPADHGTYACVAGDPGARGSLAGRVTGRAADDADTSVQQNYMQEGTLLSLAATRRLREALDAGEIPRDLLESMLAEVHMGMKDVRFFGNPLGGKPEVRELWMRAKDGRLEGVSDVSASKRGIFSHEMKLKWTGVVETDDAGIVRVRLYGEGEFKLWWKGNADPEMTFRTLFAGTEIDVESPVRFGMELDRREDGPERDPASPETIGPKVKRLQERLRGDARGVDLREFERLMKAGDFEGAEAELDRILDALD